MLFLSAGESLLIFVASGLVLLSGGRLFEEEEVEVEFDLVT